ncbi:SDR family oxidoreductase [Streptomyces sp. LX-29]|uniref:type I polyketide synthase n=1 Tax=Streptomyces sp. LX-29 TaxID=2900152 RepID=UPI00240DCF69|nr:type I polyketide synthase [Streptomyces sp. LX-29]WFB05961.1 SDR family oxidoreductase [Streptomyces sp. LX-29]
MNTALDFPDFLIGISPFGEPDARLVAAFSSAGGLGVLDLGTGDRRARGALEQVRRWTAGRRYGVRVGAGCRLTHEDLTVGLAADENAPDTVVLGVDAGWSAHALIGRHRVLAEVTGLEEAVAAVRAGVDGLIARGGESGGRVGRLGTFVLLQQLLGAAEVSVPVWACGGIGPRTAAAAVAGGAAGVVVDSQLALLAESGVAAETAAALRSLDGSETVVVDGRRGLRRRGAPPTRAATSADGVRTDPDAKDPAAKGDAPEDPAGKVVDGPNDTAAHDVHPQDDAATADRPAAREDGEDRLLPVGQDGFLAARFAAHWHTVGRTVQALTEAVRDCRHTAPAQAALRPGAAICDTLGTRLPLAQGPMTRVSDQAGFASAVAGEGALPFIALALAGPEQSRALLREAEAALAGRPWGVGVLGFAPEEVRSAQLEAIREVRPSHAVIAGGRPSQAKALERDGITTFLHVPSPGLLRQFLRAGARRFVFEGAECGGHVGPRNSFPLWEAQMAVIEDFLDEQDAGTGASAGTGPGVGTGPYADAGPGGGAGAPGRIEVFFAGGVHDERSAAMIAALAAPLTRRGVAVGLLMGTAYLFTEEAVEHGAIQPLFQRQVVGARCTTLLETAPGHATRCVPNPFTEGFHAVKERLHAQGVPARQRWEDLERLNVGRLRIASKGVERGPDGELLPVGEDRQLDEGVFMAGDVVALRSTVTTVDALHRSVTSGAADLLDRRAAELRELLGADATLDSAEPTPPRPLDVAVIGLACMFPKAPDLATFWANVLDGVDAVTEVPADRWDPAVHYRAPDGAGARGGDGATTVSRWGGFLPRIPFDPLRFGIPPASLGSIEPVQLLALEAARRALEDAGYGDREGRAFDRARTSVVFGAEAGSDLSNARTLHAVLPSYLDTVPPGLAEQLPPLTEDSFPGMLANVISGRIANRLDLGGANYTVDAACASSLAAVDVACKELATGTSDLVLCGGADLHNGITDYVYFSSVHALSATGRCRSFDQAADGIALGEGVACAVLKRLADAERDGDRVYAVIKGVGSSSDGRSLGLTAPRPEGQRSALERAYRNAGVSPADVGLIEAHGTGTAVGDRTELSVLEAVFTAAGATPAGCALGSVKSQIGHTKCAAGLAGLVKTALALHTGVKPPTVHLERPNSAWERESSPFVFHAEPRPWAAPPAERVAGISAFGFGGTNFHVVLSAHGRGAPPAHGLDAWPAELFVFRGADRAAALRGVDEMLRLTAANDAAGRPWRLRDLALTASRRAAAGHGPAQVALVAEDLDGLDRRLRRALAGEAEPGAGVHLADPEVAAGGRPEPGRLAFLFPGQGSQRTGMFADLFVAFPELHRYLELDPALAAVLYPPAAFDKAERARQRERLTDTRAAQPALGVVGLAAYSLLRAAGLDPDMGAGHSYGELVALCAAGAMDARTLLRLSAERAAAVHDAAADAPEGPGTMAAVTAGHEEVERALKETEWADRVVVANHNAPGQTVISGPVAAVDAAVGALRAAGHSARRIAVACAFHSPLVAAAGDRFAAALAGWPLRAPEFPVWANRTAAEHGADPESLRAELAAQIGAPVRFAEQIEDMYDAGARVFVEVGPGAVLTRLVGEILDGRPHRAVAVERRAAGSGLAGLLDALARLAVAGLPVRTDWMFRARDAVEADAAAPPRRPGWSVDGHLVRTADGAVIPGALAPPRRVAEPVVAAPPAGGPQRSTDELLLEFLRTSRDLVATQRDVLLSYLGAAAGGRIPAPLPPVPAPGAAAVAFAPGLLPGVATPLTAAVAPTAPATAAPFAPFTPFAPTAAPEGADPVPRPGGAPSPAVAAAPAALTEADVLRVVSEVISERTGYPVDMIEPDLDLEADLSVDSIKRAEIAGEFARRLGVGGEGGADVPDDGELEELARARTAAAAAAWLSGRLAAGAPPGTHDGASSATAHEGAPATDHGTLMPPATDQWAPPAADHPVPPAADPPGARVAPLASNASVATIATVASVTSVVSTASAAPAASIPAHASTAAAPPSTPPGDAPRRMRLHPVPLGDRAADPARLAGRRFALLGGGDVARALVARLAEFEAEAVALEAGHLLTERDGAVDGVVLLCALADTEPGADTDAGVATHPPVLPEAFPVLQAALRQRPGRLLAARTADNPLDVRAAGLHGLFRSVSREYPKTLARVVDLPGRASADTLAEMLLAELSTEDEDAPVVLRTGAGRAGLELREEPLAGLAVSGAGPAGDGAAEAAAVGLDRDAVVVLVGGARGITAQFALALASAARCRVELIGRTPEPVGPEDPTTAGAADQASLRAVLAARGGLSPAEVQRESARVLAGREVAATLAELRARTGRARYRAVDVRDGDAVRRAVAEIHAEHGRLDGVVYGAGVIEDRLLLEKSAESFRRVYGTKVDGAAALLDALEERAVHPAFVVLFGSIAAVLGNRGQADYAAANDALEALGTRWSLRTGGRALTVHWGPWAPAAEHAGMVSPELGRAYARRGVRLVDPEEGTLALLRELAWGDERSRSVVYTASGW